jgi:hypothetical protein
LRSCAYALDTVPPGWITKSQALLLVHRSMKRFEQSIKRHNIETRYVARPGKRPAPIYREADIMPLIRQRVTLKPPTSAAMPTALSPVQEPPAGIYFAETVCGSFIKIGYSNHIPRRMSELGTLRPSAFSFRLVGSFPGSLATEQWLHRRFDGIRDSGEWFRATPELRHFITTLLGLEVGV